MRRSTTSCRIWPVAAVTVLLGACGPAHETPVDPASSAQPATLLLRIERSGGLAGPSVPVGRPPILSGYADGRVVTPGPQIAIYPAPALPAVQVQRLEPDKVRSLAKEAVEAGVLRSTDFGVPHVADATVTSVTAVMDGVHRVDVTALAEAPTDSRHLTPAQQAARAELRAFIEHATRLPTAPGAPEPVPYHSDALAVLARPYTVSGDHLPSHPAARPWPGPDLPGPALPGPGTVGCTIVTGAQADELRAAARDANVRTPWTSENKRWDVTFRPLLPDESNCADLAALPHHRQR